MLSTALKHSHSKFGTFFVVVVVFSVLDSGPTDKKTSFIPDGLLGEPRSELNALLMELK